MPVTVWTCSRTGMHTLASTASHRSTPAESHTHTHTHTEAHSRLQELVNTDGSAHTQKHSRKTARRVCPNFTQNCFSEGSELSNLFLTSPQAPKTRAREGCGETHKQPRRWAESQSGQGTARGVGQDHPGAKAGLQGAVSGRRAMTGHREAARARGPDGEDARAASRTPAVSYQSPTPTPTRAQPGAHQSLFNISG